MSPLERDLRDGEPWVFDEDVVREFDAMLEKSIPEIWQMRRDVFAVGNSFVLDERARPEWVLDLGAARGEAIAPFVGCYETARNVGFAAVEISEPMREALSRRFSGFESVSVIDHDLRAGLPPIDLRPEYGPVLSLVLSVLTLQFVPVNYRLGLAAEIHEKLRPGGALLLVEKVIGSGPSIDRLLVELHEQRKLESYSQDEIDRKRLALEGVLVPLTASWNEQLLRTAGFREVDCFWRSLNFAGWLAVKS